MASTSASQVIFVKRGTFELVEKPHQEDSDRVATESQHREDYYFTKPNADKISTATATSSSSSSSALVVPAAAVANTSTNNSHARFHGKHRLRKLSFKQMFRGHNNQKQSATQASTGSVDKGGRHTPIMTKKISKEKSNTRVNTLPDDEKLGSHTSPATAKDKKATTKKPLKRPPLELEEERENANQHMKTEIVKADSQTNDGEQVLVLQIPNDEAVEAVSLGRGRSPSPGANDKDHYMTYTERLFQEVPAAVGSNNNLVVYYHPESKSSSSSSSGSSRDSSQKEEEDDESTIYARRIHETGDKKSSSKDKTTSPLFFNNDGETANVDTAFPDTTSVASSIVETGDRYEPLHIQNKLVRFMDSTNPKTKTSNRRSDNRLTKPPTATWQKNNKIQGKRSTTNVFDQLSEASDEESSSKYAPKRSTLHTINCSSDEDEESYETTLDEERSLEYTPAKERSGCSIPEPAATRVRTPLNEHNLRLEPRFALKDSTRNSKKNNTPSTDREWDDMQRQIQDGLQRVDASSIDRQASQFSSTSSVVSGDDSSGYSTVDLESFPSFGTGISSAYRKPLNIPLTEEMKDMVKELKGNPGVFVKWLSPS